MGLECKLLNEWGLHPLHPVQNSKTIKATEIPPTLWDFQGVGCADLEKIALDSNGRKDLNSREKD